jgi:hypothetical protein
MYYVHGVSAVHTSSGAETNKQLVHALALAFHVTGAHCGEAAQ